MRRPTKASPAMMRRAEAFFAPLDRKTAPPIERKPDDDHQLDLADSKTVESKDAPKN